MTIPPRARHGLAIVAIALAYYVSGQLGLLLAIPPGYATAVWPPSGVALAAILLLGNRAWPGVWLGSFAVNVVTAFDTASLTTLLWSLSLPASIGTGATLQALAGAWFVRRVIGFPSALDSERDVAWFMLLAGPVSCLVNSIIGVTTLWAHGLLATDALFFNWWTWWVGDAIGVMLFVPLILCLAERTHPVWRRRRLSVALPLVCTFALAVLVFVYASHQEQRRLEGVFNLRASTLAQALVQSTGGINQLLHALGGLYASTEVDRRRFSAFAGALLPDNPGVRSLSWNPQVPDAERAHLEAAARADGIAGFQFRDRDTAGALVRAARRESYVPVYFIEPTPGNEIVLGLDVAVDPARRRALDFARASGEPAISAPIRLTGDPAPQTGFLLAFAIYRPATGAEARRLRGYVVAAYRATDLIDAALRNFDRRGVELRVVDGDEVLYETGKPQGNAPVARPLLQWRTTLGVGGREWRLTFAATPEYVAAQRSWAAWLVLAGGLLFASLLGVFLLILTGRSSRVEQRVAERTEELSLANRQLQEQIAERRRAQEQLAQKTAELMRSNQELEHFASTASHDLKEPLRTIANYTERLTKRLHGKLDDKAVEYLGFTTAAVNRMQRLIQGLLEYARIGTATRVLAPTDFAERLKEAIHNLSATVQESGAEISFEALPTLNADATQIVQLFQNLVGNALKFRGNEAPRVHVSATAARDHWLFAVRDNGIGIEPRDRERIFEIFQRLHSIDDYPGSGIGLAMCKKIVERHGGRLWVDAAPGRGSTFYFRLPRD
jgi:signal transduction histidine kinase/integral membrane sensor domain MASE1